MRARVAKLSSTVSAVSVIVLVASSSACGGSGRNRDRRGGGSVDAGLDASNSDSGRVMPFDAGRVDAGSVDECVAFSSERCYTGPPGTEGVGACRPGIRECLPARGGYGACMNEVLPTTETCVTELDEDCDGRANEEGEACLCVPGQGDACYEGPSGTRGVGACRDGQRTCLSNGREHGACEAWVGPRAEDCLAPLDEDCNGEVGDCLSTWSHRFGDVARQTGTNDGEWAQDVAVSAAGVAIVGRAVGAVQFAGGPRLDNPDDSDEPQGFVAVLDTNGTHVFSRRFTDPGAGFSSSEVFSVAMSAGGEVVVGGVTNGTTSFGGTPFTGVGAMVAVYEPNGTLRFDLEAAGTDDDGTSAVAFTPEGDVVIGGAFQSSIDWGGGPLPRDIVDGSDDFFVAKFEGADGSHLFSVGGGGSGGQRVRWLAVASDGSILAGIRNEAGVLDPGDGVMTTARFVAACYEPNGALRWAQPIDHVDVATLGFAPDGDAIVAGRRFGSSSPDFGGGTIDSSRGSEFFIARLDPETGAPGAIMMFGNEPYFQTISMDGAVVGDAVVLAGNFWGSTFNLGGGALVSAGDHDYFVAVLGLDGSHRHSQRYGSFREDSFPPMRIAASANAMAVAGSFRESIDFGTGVLESAGHEDGFVAFMVRP